MVGCLSNHFEKIQILTISKNRIGLQGAESIASCFKHMKSLHTLDLSYDEIGDPGIEILCTELV